MKSSVKVQVECLCRGHSPYYSQENLASINNYTSVCCGFLALRIISQYHTCWCPGGKCRQGICRYDIDIYGMLYIDSLHEKMNPSVFIFLWWHMHTITSISGWISIFSYMYANLGLHWFCLSLRWRAAYLTQIFMSSLVPETADCFVQNPFWHQWWSLIYNNQ